MEAFTIIVPVFKEKTALSFSSFYFNALGLRPVYALDLKASMRRAEVENLVGDHVVIYHNPGNFLEANYQRLAGLSETDWILRVDCDEIPNIAMIEHCKKFVCSPTDAFCGFDRDDLIWRDGTFERLKFAPLYFDLQFRLFNRRKVRYIDVLHTAGFSRPWWKLPLFPKWHAPPAARLYHLNRTFLSPSARIEKQDRYRHAGQRAALDAWHRRPDQSFSWKKVTDASLVQIFSSWLAAHPEMKLPARP